MKKFMLTFLFLLFLIPSITIGQLKKAYILSEGGYSSGTSKLSLYNISENTFAQSIFSPGNIGLYPDGLIFFNSNLYLLEQGSYGGQGKIYKLDTNGIVQNYISFGINPYSLAISNSKVYATNGPASKVTVLDVNNFSTVKEISVGVYPQEIIAYNNNVFVCNTSLYGGSKDSTVSVINSVTDSVVAKITVHKDPSSLAISKDNALLIGCPGSSGKIFKVDLSTYQKIDSISLSSGFDKDISVDMNTGNIYYINYNNGISYCNFSTGQVADIISNPNPSSDYFYGYNYDYTISKHFITDAKDFTTTGSLYVYNSSGNLENTFTTGIAPRRVVFNSSSSVSVKQISEVASGFKLYQNYPNPFNPSTVIKFSLPKTDFVNLMVYDITGKEVSKLLNETKKAGTYEINFSGEKLNSGVYFCRISTSSYSDVKRMILVK
jgi:YVTN family beta-propeller protein